MLAMSQQHQYNYRDPMFQEHQGYPNGGQAQFVPATSYPTEERDVFQLKREQTEQLRNVEIQKWQMSVRENQNANHHGYDNSNIVKTHKRKIDDVENNESEYDGKRTDFANGLPVSPNENSYQPYTTKFDKRTKFEQDTGDITNSRPKTQSGFGAGYQFNGVFENDSHSFMEPDNQRIYDNYNGHHQPQNMMYQQGRDIRPPVVY